MSRWSDSLNNFLSSSAVLNLCGENKKLQHHWRSSGFSVILEQIYTSLLVITNPLDFRFNFLQSWRGKAQKSH